MKYAIQALALALLVMTGLNAHAEQKFRTSSDNQPRYKEDEYAEEVAQSEKAPQEKLCDKFIQISAFQSKTGEVVYALCADGSVWTNTLWGGDSSNWYGWQSIPKETRKVRKE